MSKYVYNVIVQYFAMPCFGGGGGSDYHLPEISFYRVGCLKLRKIKLKMEIFEVQCAQ